MMKLKVDAIIFFVQDVGRLKTFYTDIFKFKILEDDGTAWVLLGADGCNIGLHRIGEPYREEAKARETADSGVKVVFELEEDLAETRERLVSEGVKMREIKTFAGYGYSGCDGEDPEGNVFQLKQKKR